MSVHPVTMLACRVADEAQALGLSLEKLQASHCAVSASCYVYLRDGAGRRWLIRVSDHARRARSPSSVPHYDLVARPAEVDQALDAVSTWLAGVAAGVVEWRDPEAARPPRKRLGIRV